MHFPGPYEVFFAELFKVAFLFNSALFIFGLTLLLFSVLRSKGIKSTILTSMSGPAIVLHGISTIGIFVAFCVSLVTEDMPMGDLGEMIVLCLFIGMVALPSIAGLFIWVALRMKILTSSDLPASLISKCGNKA